MSLIIVDEITLESKHGPEISSDRRPVALTREDSSGPQDSTSSKSRHVYRRPLMADEITTARSRYARVCQRKPDARLVGTLHAFRPEGQRIGPSYSSPVVCHAPEAPWNCASEPAARPHRAHSPFFPGRGFEGRA